MRQFAFLAAIWSLAANAQKLPQDLTAATLEELMNFEVTSVRRADRPEELDARRDTDWKMTYDGFCADWNLSRPGFPDGPSLSIPRVRGPRSQDTNPDSSIPCMSPKGLSLPHVSVAVSTRGLYGASSSGRNITLA